MPRTPLGKEASSADNPAEEVSLGAIAPNAYADWLRAARAERKVSVNDLVERSRVSRDYLYKLQEGRSWPSREVAVRLAVALGFTAEQGLLAAYYLPASFADFREVSLQEGLDTGFKELMVTYLVLSPHERWLLREGAHLVERYIQANRKTTEEERELATLLLEQYQNEDTYLGEKAD